MKIRRRAGEIKDQKSSTEIVSFLSARHPSCRRRLEAEDVDLGQGKRMIIKGGAYDATHQITVPRKMTLEDWSWIKTDKI